MLAARAAEDTSGTQPDSIEHLLRELDIDREALVAEVEQQKKDISGIHEVLNGYTLTTENKCITKKTQREIKRYLNSEFRQRWGSETLANDPMRFKNLLESIASKADTSTYVKESVKRYLVEQVKNYIDKTASQTNPEIIGKRIEASLLPSQETQTLQETLLGTYFKSAERLQDMEGVLDNYERFIFGIIRVIGDKPELAKRALNVACFETDLLAADSLYALKALRLPSYRLDKPELYARAWGTLVTIFRMSASLDVVNKSPKLVNPLANMKDYIENYQGGPIDQRTFRRLKKDYGWQASIHIKLAQDAIGEEELERRFQVVEELRGLFTDEKKLSSIIFDELNNGAGFSSTIVYAGEYLKSKYPDMVEFIDRIVKAEVPLNKELAKQTSETPLFGLSDKVLDLDITDKWMRAYLQNLSSADEDISGLLPQLATTKELVSFAKTRSQNVSWPTGDGFMIDIILSNDIIIDNQLVSEILDEFGSEIEKAKQVIATLPDSGRQAYTISDPDRLFFINVRPESAQDKKKLHPLDAILGKIDAPDEEYDPRTSLIDSLHTIEEARDTILTRRRRFLNERGVYLVDTQDKESIKIVIKKHTSNPNYFICDFEYSDNEGTENAKVLMGPDLLFHLGDRKVRSPENLAELNAMTAVILVYFMTHEVIDTEEGQVGDNKNSVTARIAHLRLLPEGQKYSYEAWGKCLEAEGLDLETLSEQQQLVYDTTRKSTYVSAVEKDDLLLGPLRIYIPAMSEEEVAV